MALLARFGVLFGLWLARKWTSHRKTPLVDGVNTLSWPSKARLTWRLIRDSRVPFWARGLAIVPALYLLSPIDLLPDFIPFAGRLDDALVFAFVSDLMLRVVPDDVMREHVASLTPAQQRRTAA
jgi:uncharacterized membrane protein YkvA (DUF1232 family)